MSPLVAPFLVTLALSLAAFFAHRAMNHLHRRMLESELGGRDYDELNEHDRQFINEVVNHKFQQSMGGRLASFVLLYAYPTLYIGEKVFGRTRWSAVEVFGGSSLLYFSLLALTGLIPQVIWP